MSGQIQDEVKLFASVEGQKLLGAKITLHTVMNIYNTTKSTSSVCLPVVRKSWLHVFHDIYSSSFNYVNENFKAKY